MLAVFTSSFTRASRLELDHCLLYAWTALRSATVRPFASFASWMILSCSGPLICLPAFSSRVAQPQKRLHRRVRRRDFRGRQFFRIRILRGCRRLAGVGVLSVDRVLHV